MPQADDKNVRNPGPDRADHPGVIAPPPLIYLGWVVLGALLHALWPIPLPGFRAGRTVGTLLILFACLLAGLSAREFRRWRTTILPHRATTAIIRTGPFRYSRNPIYLAGGLLHLGIGALANSLWIVIAVIPAVATIGWAVIAREERYLERKFGSEYLDYKASVRRWV